MRTDRKYFHVLVVVGFLVLIWGCTQKPAEKAISGEELILKESNPVGVHHADRAFDKNISPDSFWESSGFPVWLQIDFQENKSKTIMKYALLAGEESKRMPKDWKFQGSNDGTMWTDLDTQMNQIDWKTNEERSYLVTKPAKYRFYRLYVTSGNQPEILRIYEIKLIE